MTVGEIREMLADVPDEYDIAMDDGSDSLMPICHTDSGLIEVQFNDTKKKIFIFVLCPCFCIPHEYESTLN